MAHSLCTRNLHRCLFAESIIQKLIYKTVMLNLRHSVILIGICHRNLLFFIVDIRRRCHFCHPVACIIGIICPVSFTICYRRHPSLCRIPAIRCTVSIFITKFGYVTAIFCILRSRCNGFCCVGWIYNFC